MLNFYVSAGHTNSVPNAWSESMLVGPLPHFIFFFLYFCGKKLVLFKNKILEQ